ncbi:uncharacterized protein BDCG_16269 [Blastomyces dermatitidis ER-3]|uniref:Uncharacterized protein n=1 Tax=Ajellomyces dermatitidis (strain ER-3 / ATCC MYA-2586) TaxID=559297 RepID=A0ABX2VR28_AJEDR|nr:uncharacterized protein BDCG_16269 [Blastomyces dermatitidis ER-3]OAS99691.1 hypothetical protein BDCG_16269 [Blastomyces dermatitidis ER-3]
MPGQVKPYHPPPPPTLHPSPPRRGFPTYWHYWPAISKRTTNIRSTFPRVHYLHLARPPLPGKRTITLTYHQPGLYRFYHHFPFHLLPSAFPNASTTTANIELKRPSHNTTSSACSVDMS